MDMVHKAQTYRYRAEELRTIAEGMQSECRERLLKLAEEYEEMAATLQEVMREPVHS